MSGEPPRVRVEEGELDFDHQGLITHQGRRFTGVAIDRFADGRVRAETSYVEGLEEGVSRQWHENGLLADEECYCRGALHGASRGWSRTGWLEQWVVYELGVLVEKATLSPEGAVLAVWRRGEPASTLLESYRRHFPEARLIASLA